MESRCIKIKTRIKRNYLFVFDLKQGIRNVATF